MMMDNVDKAGILKNSAIIATDENNIEEAIKLYEKAAILYESSGKYELSGECYESAGDLCPHNMDTYEKALQIYYSIGCLSSAYRNFIKLICSCDTTLINVYSEKYDKLFYHK